jgi:hypothetical protein
MTEETSGGGERGREEIPPELAQYLAHSVIDTLPAEIYEELKKLDDKELRALTRLGKVLRRHECEPHHYTFIIH